ncbi:MAG TPA: alpha/beta hydrolase [Capillimicrobium sp.]|nr:alpha/beta hydrolase [Capillimicrobium sp.]
MSVAPEHHGGSGTPLLLLHGFTDTWRAWTPLLGALEEHHEVLAPTLPGHHGGTPWPDEVAMSVDATVDLIERRMEAAGWETAHIAGSSYGGWLALELATRGRARSVVGICPAGGWEHGSKEADHVYGYFERTHRTMRLAVPKVMELIAKRPRLRKLALRELVAHPERVPSRCAMDMMEGAKGCAIVAEAIAMGRQEGSWSELGPIDVPVRIAYGSRDWLIRWPSHYGRLQRLLPNAEFVPLDDCGHLPMWDDPPQVSRAILDVTTAVDRAAEGSAGDDSAAALR